MRSPSSTIVLDAAILIAAARGRSSGALLQAAAAVNLITTDRALHEARRRIELGLKRPELVEIIDALAREITIIPMAELEPLLEPATRALIEAVPSRNGSHTDAHMLALAWAADADVWSADRDFAGTGVPSWSTPNLMRALAGGSEQS